MDILFIFGIGILRILQSFFNKQSSRHLDSMDSYFRFGLYFESAAAVFALFYLAITGFYGLNAPTILCSLLMGTSFLLELTTSLKALQNAPLTLCTMCALGGGIVLPTIAGIFFFGEPMSIWQWLGVALFFVSAYFLLPAEKKTVNIKKSTVVILVCNFVINGACGIINKFFAVDVEGGNAAMFACLSYVFAAIWFMSIILIKRAKATSGEHKLPELKSNGYLPKPVYFFGGAVGAVCASIVFFNTVLSRTVSILILNTIPNAVCLIGSLVIDVTLFKGKITVPKILCVALNILATTVIVLF